MAVVPEVRLMLATGGGEALDPAIAQFTSRPLDWQVFLGLVQRERAAAVVWPRLRRLGADSIPLEARAYLQREAMLADVRMARMSQRLDQTLHALATADIPTMLLKGAALGRTVYRSLPRRPMLDLDILVPEGRTAQALEVVLSAGWESGPYQELGGTFYQDHYHLPPLRDRGGGDFSLELHHGLFFRGHPFGLQMGELWERARSLPDAPHTKVPDPTHMILHLAIHFAWSHTMRSAAWRTFRDLRFLTEDSGIDWDEVVRESRRVRATTCCYWTFRLARRWAGVAVPESVLRALRPPMLESGLRVLDQHFVQQWYPGDLSCPSIRLDWALWRAAIRPKWSGHGSVLPWQRDERFEYPDVTAPPADAAPHKLRRHLGNLGAYFRYFRRILATDS